MIDVGRVALYDLEVTVAADPPLAAELSTALVDLRVDPDAGGTAAADHVLCVGVDDGTWEVTWDGATRYRGPEVHIALYDSLIALNQATAARAVQLGWTVLHGGSAVIEGRAVAVVGHSGAGKSTLTAGFARAGFPYLADEVVGIRPDFTVAPFHRPVGLRSGGAGQLEIDVPDGPYGSVMPYPVGLHHPLSTGAPLALVAVLRRGDTVDHAHVDVVEPARALFELANQTLGATDFERSMFRRLEHLVRHVTVVELHYGNVHHAIEQLRSEITAGAPASGRRGPP